MSEDVLDSFALVLSIFGIVTIPLYAALLRMLFLERKQSFPGPFYRLFFVLGLLDILATTNNFIGVSLPGWGVSTVFVRFHGRFYSRIYLSIAWFTRVNQGTSSVLIAANRAYALLSPVRYAQISKKFTWQYVIQTIPGLLFAISVAFMDSDYVFFESRPFRKATPRILSEESRRAVYLVGGGCEIFQVFAIVSSYSICIYKLTFRRKLTKAKKNQEESVSAERSATFLGVCICGTEVILFAYMIFSNFFKTEPPTYFSVHSSMTDLYSLVNCYFLILFSKSVRRKLWESLCFRRITVVKINLPKSIEVSSSRTPY